MPIKNQKVVVSKKETAKKKITKKKSTKMPQKKCEKKNTKRVGRPTVMTDAVLQKLREAFLMGCTDAEACLYAEIEPSTLYNFQRENIEFLEGKEHLKNNTILRARKVIFDKISEGDENTAKWYLERKAKQEFSSKTEIGITDKNGEDIIIFIPDNGRN